MTRWKITPTWKKSIVEIQEWTKSNSNDVITYEIGWRWGEFFIETEEPNPPAMLTEGVDMFNCGYDCDDWSTEDGHYSDVEVDVEDDTERERLEEFLSENSVYDLEDEGWIMSECYMYINSELSIEKVNDI